MFPRSDMKKLQRHVLKLRNKLITYRPLLRGFIVDVIFRMFMFQIF